MKFLRLGEPGHEIPVVLSGGTHHSLDTLTADIDGAFLAADGIRRTREALDAGRLAPIEAEGLRVGAPISRPSAVVCVGQNYAAHAAESGDAPPAQPIIFFKHPNTVVGPFDDVRVTDDAEKLDWEVELGVVIGRRAWRLDSPAEALDHVAGLVTSHDVSERAWQTTHSGGQWSMGKTAPTFNPVGPYLVPIDEVDPQSLRLWSTVNGEPRQDSNTADMIFDVALLVWHLSQYMALDPGDLVNTGTPQGVALSGRFPYLKTGDVIEIGIEHLGTQRQTVVRESARRGAE